MTMFYFSFILRVWPLWNNSETLKQFVLGFYFSFISHVRATEIKLSYLVYFASNKVFIKESYYYYYYYYISVLFYVVSLVWATLEM